MKKGTQKQKKWQKIAKMKRFNLLRNVVIPTLYAVSWPKSNGKYGRRRFQAVDIDAALEQAPKIAGLEPSQAGHEKIRLVDAFEVTLASTKRGEKSRHDWLYCVERFMIWLAKTYPNCTHWHLLTRKVVRDYLAMFDGKSATTRRLALQPITQTSGFMSREYGLPDVASKLGIGSKLQSTPKEVYLPDVVALCDFLAKENPRLEVGVALQGLASLQLQEATRLRWKNVNLQRGLIEITGEVKNEYRKRVIPVCSRVLDALKRARERRETRGVVDLYEAVVVRPLGGAYGDDWPAYGKHVLAEIKKWNPKIEWKTKDLRKCLPTFAAISGLRNDVWEQYFGHAPRSITARHYIPRLASASHGESEALERQANLFRFHVVQPLEKAMDSKGEARILNFFEQRRV